MASVQAWVEGKLADLPPIPTYTTVDDFIAQIAEARKRHIDLRADPGLPPQKVCGLWIEEDDQDVIHYSAHLRGVQRDNTLLHETSHILLDHRGVDADLAAQAATLLEGFTPEAVRRMLGRTRYDDDQEFEAEALGMYYQTGSLGQNRRRWLGSRRKTAAHNLLGG